MRILVVEDDIHLAESLEEILKENDYDVDMVHNGQDGLYYASNSEYDAIVLDVMMPKMNGYEMIRALRMLKIATPTIMLTAKGELGDKVQGLDFGVDDYMVKPFEPLELLARLRALTRRSGEVIIDELEAGDLVLNLNNHTLTCNTRAVALNNKEFKILNILMASAGNIISKENLIIKVWGIASDVTDNNIEAYISFLRKKLSYVGSSMSIGVVRMVGYRLEGNGND